VLPGLYSLKLLVDGKEAAGASLEVQGDPDITISDADRRSHFDTLMALHELQRQANAGHDAVATLDGQVAAVKERMKDATVPDAVKTAVDEFDKELAKVKPRFGVGVTGFGGSGAMRNVRQRIGMLKGQIMGSTSLPTETQVQQLADGRKALASATDEVNAVIAKASTLYQVLAASNVLMEIPKPIAASGR
jgi:hypothetical protein